MENSRILNWWRWSATRKTQVIVTACGFLLTTGFMLYDVLPIEDPRNWLSTQLWGIGMVLEAPSDAVARLAGLWETGPRWLVRVLAVCMNTVLAFVLGTILGWLITTVKHARNRRSQ